MRKYSSLLVLFSSALLVHAQTFSNGQAARAVLGQTNFTAGNPNSNQYTLGAVSGLAYANGRLWVADSNRGAATPNNSRVVGFFTGEIPGLHDDLGKDGLTNADCYLCGFGAFVSLGQSTWVPPNGNTQCPAADVSAGISPCFYTNPSGRTANSLANATGVATDGHYFAIADTDNNRVLLWNEIPSSMNQNADVVLGQKDFTSFATPAVNYFDKFTMRGPQGVWIQNNHLFVADTQNNRVLIWNTIPTQNNQGPDLVLGQNNFNVNYQPNPSSTAPTVAANQLLDPVAVTADATHLYVSDLGNNRILIWNEFPTANAQNADVVVGQPDMTQSAANNPNVCQGYVVGVLAAQCETSLNLPRYALPINGQLFVADGGNDRVLIFNPIPTTNGKNATGVLGEPDFQQDVVSSASISIASTAIDNTGGVDLLATPQALAWDGTNLYVSDPYNRRISVFTPGDTVLAPNSIVNWASEIIRQEGIVQIAFPSSSVTSTVVGDTVTVTIGSAPAYVYKVVKGDTLDSIAQGLVKLINADTANNGPTSTNPTAVTAIFDGTGTGTFYLSSNSSNLPYDDITLTAVASNKDDLTVTPSGGYLSAGTAATGAIGMLVEINGNNLSDSSANSTLDGVTVLPNSLAGVQVYMDGYACPLLKVSPTQIVTQIPYSYLDRNSTSVYIRTTHSDGSVSVTAAVPVYIAPANPGIFDAPAYAGQTRPWPIAQALHQPGNANATIDFEGTPTLGNTATITISGVAYTYAVSATDVATGLLNTIVTNMVNLINATDTHVTATVGGAFNRILLTAKQPGAAGSGISIAVSSATSATNTAAGNLTLTNYNLNGTCCVVTPNSPIIPTNPAAPGELVQIIGTGLGIVTDPTNVAQGSLGTGVPYAGPANNTAQSFVTATMGGTTAQVVNASLPPGSYGTYNIQTIVPESEPTSTAATLNIAQNAFISNTVTIPVGPPVLYVVPPPAAPATTITEMIESPAPSSTVSGTLYASGWALNSKSPLTTVTVAIDGRTYQSAQIGFTRTDVCAIYTSPVCPYVGWYLPIDTTQFADGTHTFAITAVSSNGSDYTISQSFSILNNTSASSNAFHGSIESPSANFPYRGSTIFSGWDAYAGGTIAGVSLYVDGAPLGATTASPRPDVCAIYPTANCPNAGWYYTIDTNSLSNGTHTLVSKAISSDGHTYALAQTFQVQNWAGSSSTTHAVIEEPSAGATYSGTLSVGGWAGDQNTSVNSIGVTVDGVSYGNAAYGFARTDVCASISLLNCTGVGFLATLDTTYLADGQHTVAVIVNLAAGQSVTYTQVFNVANTGTAANPVQGVIDTPTANTTVAGAFSASGWAISTAPNDPVTTVSLKVDGSSFGNATYGGTRNDVCAAYASAVGCPGVGWNASLNSALLGNGQHVLEITMSTGAGHRASVNTSFTVANPVTGPGHIGIDNPTAASNAFQGTVLFSGYAVNDNSAVSSVSLTIDGVPYGAATYNLARPDVCAAYPADAGCQTSGWTFGIDTTKLTDGAHTLGVTENNANGTFYTASQAFTVANNSASNPLVIIIEAPTSEFGIYGTVSISGWATLSNDKITAVNIAVDGVPIGSATYGTPRTDVCLVTSSPTCPNVGWYFSGFNTQLLPNGSHTLDITAVTALGQSSTITRQITIAN